MRENPQKHKEKRQTGTRIMSVVDIVTTCPKCGGEVGIWSEDTVTRCIFCDYPLFERERTIH